MSFTLMPLNSGEWPVLSRTVIKDPVSNSEGKEPNDSPVSEIQLGTGKELN